MIRRHSTTRLPAAAVFTAGIALLVLAGPAVAQGGIPDELVSASYVRTVDGRATLLSDRGGAEAVDPQEPLLEGDRVTVDRGARLEVELADRSRLHLANDASLSLDAVAFSADGDSRETVLTLDDGELLLTVTDDALGDRLPTVRTPAADLFVHEPGRYRVDVRPTSVEIVVREGFLEVLTDRGSTVVRTGEAATIDRDRWQRVTLLTAGPYDALERWSDELERGARWADSREVHVEPHLAYAAAPLRAHGTWVEVDTVWYWRPRVAVGWRPYWSGRWSWTPGGLTWVSYEPWGWVPYHYGTWVVNPRYGWVWRPGRVYRPAWVYWRIGPEYSAWCPIGFFAGGHGPSWGFGLRFGTYGWAGGGWGLYADWVFTPTRRVFDRSRDPWRQSGAHLGRTHHGQLARGVLTTDTRGYGRDRWQSPDRLIAEVSARATPRGTPLADVTDFVARRRDLPPPVRRAVESPDARASLERVAIAAPRSRGRSTELERGREWAREQGRDRRLDSSRTAIGLDRRSAVGSRRPTDVRAARPSPRAEPDRRLPVGKADPGSRQGWRQDRTEARGPIDARGAGRPNVDRGASTARATDPRGRIIERGRSGDRPAPPVARVIDGVRRGEPNGRSSSSSNRAGASADARLRAKPGARSVEERPSARSRDDASKPPARQPILRSRPSTGGGSPVVDRSRSGASSPPVARPSTGAVRDHSPARVTAKPTAPRQGATARSSSKRGGSSSKASSGSSKGRSSASEDRASKPPQRKSSGGKGDRDH